VSKDIMEEKNNEKKNEKFIQFKSKFIKNNDKQDEDKGKETQKNKDKKGKKSKKGNLEIKVYSITEEDNKEYYEFSLTEKPEYKEETKELILKTGSVKVIKNVKKTEDKFEIVSEDKTVLGEISIEFIKNAYKIEFSLNEDIKKKRIEQILDVIHNGLLAHSGGEDNTIIPLFFIAGAVKVPSPVFHPYISIEKVNEDYKILGLSDCINNSWVLDKKIYIKCSERIKCEEKCEEENLIKSFEEFKKNLEIKEKQS